MLMSATSAWPLSARARRAGKLPTVGFLGASLSIESQRVAAFVQRLRELGWIDGRNVAIDYRWAEGRNERYAEAAAELVRLKVDIIVTVATPATLAAKEATTVIPIVFGAASDPVGTGLVENSGATRRQHHRSVKSDNGCRWEEARIPARDCAQSAPIGDLDECRQSRRCDGHGRGPGSGPQARPGGNNI